MESGFFCRIKKYAGAGLIAAVVAFTFGAGANAEDASTYKGVLPGDAIVHIRTGACKQSLGNIEAFLTKAVQGTPAMMMMAPGMLQMQLPKLTKFPMEMLDTTKPIQFIVCNPPMPGMKPHAALLVPIAGFSEKIAALKATGIAVEELEPGVYSPVVDGVKSVIVDTGKEYAALAPKADSAKHVAALFKTWQQKPVSQKPNSSSMVITVDIGKITTLNSAALDMAQQMAMAKLQAKAAAPSSPPIWGKLVAVAPKYLEKIKGFVKSAKSLRVYLYPSADALNVSGFLTPVQGTPMRAFAEAYEGKAPVYELVKLMPEESVLAEAFTYDAAASADLKVFMSEFVKDAVGLVDESQSEAMAANVGKAMDLIEGEGCVSIVPGTQDGPNRITVVKVKDGAEYAKVMDGIFGSIDPLIKSILAMVPMTTPMPLDFNAQYVKEAGAVDGTPFAKLTFAMAEVDEAQLNDMQKAMLSNIKSTLKVQSQCIAVVDNLVVTVAGPEGQKNLEKVVKALKSKSMGMGNNALFVEALNAAKPKQVAFTQIYLLDLIKQFVLQSLSADPINGAPLIPAALAMPKSTQTIPMSVGVSKGSFKFKSYVPAAAISETAVGVMGLIMQAQMMQHQKGGGQMPPAAPPGGNTF